MPVVSPTRRSILATSAAGASRPLHAAAVTEASTIRQFKVNVLEETLVELRRRLATTRWPDRETVADRPPRKGS